MATTTGSTTRAPNAAVTHGLWRGHLPIPLPVATLASMPVFCVNPFLGSRLWAVLAAAMTAWTGFETWREGLFTWPSSRWPRAFATVTRLDDPVPYAMKTMGDPSWQANREITFRAGTRDYTGRSMGYR